MKKLLFFFFSISALHVKAQKKYPEFFRNEFRFINDNDAYMLKRKDGYYTNGIFLQFNWAANTNHKKVHSVEVGQRMYTSRNRFMNSLSVYDRPFAGYLYSKYQQTTFTKKDAVIRYGVALGTIGPNALAKELQTKYHKLIGIYKIYGWDVQVKNEIGLNGSFTWSPVLIHPKTNKQLFAIKPVLTANLGNTFTNAEFGSVFEFGAFEKNEHSMLWNASVENAASQRQREFELFVFFHPQLIVTAYNATVQGGLFRNDKGIFTADVNRFMYRHRLGVSFAYKRLTGGFDAVFETKEAKTQKAFQRYGTLHMGYRFN